VLKLCNMLLTTVMSFGWIFTVLHQHVTLKSDFCVLQVIADNVGDNVGDIAGMGSDLFGSYAESSCAALVVASISSFGINHEFTPMLYPLLISSVGIIACLITTLFATDFFEIKAVDEIEPALKKQLIISTAVMTVGIALVSWLGLPYTFTIFNFGVQKTVYNWYCHFFN
jgi:H+-translocating diphosphatase